MQEMQVRSLSQEDPLEEGMATHSILTQLARLTKVTVRASGETRARPFQLRIRDPLAARTLGFSGGSDGKESACNAGDLGWIPGSGRSPEKGKGYPLQYSCLEHSMDRGAWQVTVHGVAKS